MRRRIGTVRQSPFREDEYELCDDSGRRTGAVRENPFDSRELEVGLDH